MLFTLVLVFHVIVCVLLTIAVLMQSSSGAALSAAFGGSGGQVFGGRETATFLSKATTWLAIAFFVTSLSLAFLSGDRSKSPDESVLRRAAREQMGTLLPEEQKNVDEVIGNVPEPGAQPGSEQPGKAGGEVK